MADQSFTNSLEALSTGAGSAIDYQDCAAVLVANITDAQSWQISSGALCGYIPHAIVYTRTVEVLMGQGVLTHAYEITNDILAEYPANFLNYQTVKEVLFAYDELSPDVQRYQPVSNYLFPTLAGLSWSVHKRPKFSTVIAPHVSGREVRVSNYVYPLYEWELTYEFLREGNSHTELETIMGFYLARAGAFDSFLYKDQNENNIYIGASLGIGDATTTKFTIMKTFGGFSEPVGYVDSTTINIYFNGVLQTTGWTYVSPNQIQFTTAPAVGVVITADYTWYYRVRFGDDNLDFENFMFNLWTLKKVTLESIKP